MEHRKVIRLQYTLNHSVVYLRELTGHDELSVVELSSEDAIRLINRLLVQAEGATEVLKAEAIVTADRDQILAELYTDNFGLKIEGSFTCKHCSECYTIDFRLPDLKQHLQANSTAAEYVNGIYKVDGCAFRLPTGEDELAIASLPAAQAAKEILTRCLIEGDPEDGSKVQKVMSEVAPIMHTEIQTICPECGAQQQVQFDIQSYLLQKLKRGQKLLTRDVHRLASQYKWSHREILDLPRRLRRMYVTIIEEEMDIQ